MGREIEIKLLSRNEATLREVFASPLVAPYLAAPPVEREFRAFYLDTPDLDLAAERIAYRIRKEGGRWVAAVKTGKVRTPEGFYVRGEWEREIPEPKANPEIFNGTEIFQRLKTLIGGKPLVVLFETRVARRFARLDFPDGTRVELVADRGEVCCHELRAPILEIELELKTGGETRLLELSRGLQKAFSLTPGTGSKYARGLGLVFEQRKKDFTPAAEFFARLIQNKS